MLNFFFGRNKRPSQRRANRRTFRPLLESLENRSLLSTLTVVNNKDSGAGSLRQAILDSNASVGVADMIAFNIGGGGAWKITPASALPNITDPVTIDGTTQPGFTGSPLIELTGVVAGSAHGLVITAGGSTVRGLVINRFSLNGIALTTNGGNIVEGNYIGTNVAGTAAEGNGVFGVFVGTAENRIGTNGDGTGDAAERNVISGNVGNGVQLQGAAANNNVIAGNYLGTDVSGTLALGNGAFGINLALGAFGNRIGTKDDGLANASEANVISGNLNTGVGISGAGSDRNIVAGNLIGIDRTGTLPLGNQGDGVFIGSEARNNRIGSNGSGVGDALERNVISANRVHGIRIDNADLNEVFGNYVGTNGSATAALGNGADGILIHNGAQGNVIGFGSPTQANTIAFNILAGVAVRDAGTTGNQILGNAIYSNGGLGIDLGADGGTPNDLGDADTGPHQLQNFPVLLDAQPGATTGVAGTLNSLANATFTLHFYVNVAAGPSGFGESQRFLGFTIVTTDGRGNASFSIQLVAGTIPGQAITATATDWAGNTSEFSAAVVVSPPIFGLQTPFATGGVFPNSVGVADFNRDGNLDIAAAGAGSDALGPGFVGVLLGNGLGGFGSASNFPGGTFPSSVVVGDFNRDDNPDLAVANLLSSNVSVLLGNGTGGFGATANFHAGTFPSSVTVGDFNGDGNPDLAVVNRESNNVSVLLGNGDGGFGATANYLVGLFPVSVALGDFNRDGNSDLAVANFGSINVSVLLGNGLGGFGSAINFPAGSGSRSVAVGDFNRDDNPDLAVANEGTNNVSVLLGNGSGGFGATASFSVGERQVSIAAADFNRDGASDLVVANRGSNKVSLLLNVSPVTTTLISSNASPSVVGQLVTFSATVSQSIPGALTPTGIVTFMEGETTLGTGTLDVNGWASFSTFALTTGYHTIKAIYQGDPNFTGSTAPVLNQLVNQSATTTTSLTSSANPWIVGAPITFAATVSGYAPGFGPPRGSVLFTDKGAGDETTTIAAVELDENGVATFTTSALAADSHALRAIYVGDNPFTGSTSPLLTQLVSNPVPAITGLGPTALPEGTPGFTLTITGEHFLSSSTVDWNGTPLAVTAVSETEIQAKVPAALLVRVGTANVVVSNPGPGGGDSIAQAFSITNAPLTVLPVHLNVFGNKNFTGPVATFTDGNPFTTAADFKAIITWPDGDTNDNNNPSDFATITGAAGGTFTVIGSHNFGAFQNLRTATVTILDRDGQAVSVVDNVIDPPAPVDDNIINPPAIIVPVAQRTNRNKVLILSESRRIAIADADSADGQMRVTLTVTSGNLKLRTTEGLERVRGNGTSKVTLIGSVASINNALNGLRFKPKPSFRGKVKLAILAQDFAQSGPVQPVKLTSAVRIFVV